MNLGTPKQCVAAEFGYWSGDDSTWPSNIPIEENGAILPEQSRPHPQCQSQI